MSAGRISMRMIPFSKRIEKRLISSASELGDYNHPFVANATKEILKKLGVEDTDSLRSFPFVLHQDFLDAHLKNNSSLAREIRLSPFFSPEDYLMSPLIFAHLHSAITGEMELCGLKDLMGKNVLQIGASWGPYMHFLHQAYFANVFGIDTNKIAVEYAKQGSLKFAVGDAGNMSFRNKSIDIVVSRDFLDYSYLNFFALDKASSFAENVISEVHRVLKPGGLFFSHFEDMIENANGLNRFHSLSKIEFPFPDRPVYILQK